MSSKIFGERADQHRLYPEGGVVGVGSASYFGVAPVWKDTMPSSPFDGMLWIDTSSRASSPVAGAPPYEMRRWNANRLVWELVGYNVMPPAGPNHATGLVGDPGDTPHTPPWYWGDDSAFHEITGGGGGAAQIEFGTGMANGGVSLSSITYPSALTDDHTSNLYGTMIPLVKVAFDGEQSWYTSAFHSDLVPAHMPGNTGTDVILLTAGAYAGAVVPLVGGWYYLTGSMRFPTHNDTNFRSVMIATITVQSSVGPRTFIGLTSGVGFFTFVKTSGGSGYSTGDTITFTGGGGSGLIGTIVAVGGQFSDIIITDIGTGYTGAPTGFSISGGGVGAAMTFSLPSRPSAVDRIIAEEVVSGIANAPVQVTVNKLWFLRPYEVIYLMAAQGSGVTLVTPTRQESFGVTYSMNEYYHTLSLFRIDETPFGPSWTPGLPG